MTVFLLSSHLGDSNQPWGAFTSVAKAQEFARASEREDMEEAGETIELELEWSTCEDWKGETAWQSMEGMTYSGAQWMITPLETDPELSDFDL